MIWCVEDDASIRDIELYALRAAGLEAEGFPDGDSFWRALQSRKPELVVLDVMLPGIDGTELLRRMRATPALRRIPVIMATARGAEYDRVQGLDSGADDYLTKPFHLAELNARIKSLIRRRQAQGDVTVTVGNLLLYPDKRQAEVGGVPLQLNRKEFDLLYYFVVNVNRVINKMSLAESVWGDNIDQADSLDFIYSQVKNLRKKLKQADASVELKAVYGFGYKLSEL